jgi:endonuclease/exonuclease/phosphatase (EEP) superfamily protein YafD
LHFYTSLRTEYIRANYFVAEDIPSIEAKLKTRNGEEFMFFGIHPPPPGPDKEETTRERDAEILAVSERIKSSNIPCLLTGDFNNVAWSRSAKLMKKNAQLLDPRIGRGFISTFHAKYLFFRFPIDLVFHTRSIYFQKLKTEKHIHSDHLPVYGEFIVNTELDKQDSFSEKVVNNDKLEIDEMIVEGKSTDSDDRQ